MQNLTETAIRLYRQLFASPELAGQLADGIETVLDGNTAVAVTEACISEVAALGGGFLEQGAALAWLSEQQRVGCNLFDQKLSVQQADSPRGALASAMGVTMSGHRSTVFLTAQDIASCQDMLLTAVGRRLPLVIHLDNRLSAMQGNSTGSGHDALHQVMDSGCFVLFAANVQEAVDFTLIARQVAEITLTPALVVMDGTETALAVQDVRLPSVELVRQFIGGADESIASPSVAQKQLFSEYRKRLHRWHDLDKPVLQGAMQEAQIFALGSAARKTYFEELIATTLEKSFSSYAQLTGRSYSGLSTYALKKADIIVVAQGSAIETVKTVSDYLSTQKKQKLKKNNSAGIEKINLGVIGLHSLRPFNSTQLIKLLSENKCATQQVVVLERMNVPLADDAPLMRELRAAIHQKMEQQSLFATVSKNTLSIKKETFSDFPKLHSIIYGLGGVKLNIADLSQLFKEVKENKLTGRYLGIPFNADSFNTDRTKEYYPKRQVMLDTLQRYYPQISTLGINAREKQLPLFSNGERFAGSSNSKNTHLSFAISHLPGSDGKIAYAMELSGFLHKLNGNFLRSFISPCWEQWAKRQTDYITQSNKPCDTGNSSLVDFFIVCSADTNALFSACQNLNDNGVLIFTDKTLSIAAENSNIENKRIASHSFSDSALLPEELLADCRSLIENKNLTLYRIDASIDDMGIEDQSNGAISLHELQWEKILATLMGVLLNSNRLNKKIRKILSIRQALLTNMSAHSAAEKQHLLSELFNNTLNAAVENLTPFASHDLKINSLRTVSSKLENDLPPMVKKLGQAAETYDSLPRFWDQVGVLQQSGESAQLTADPYLATGIIPSLTATFNDISQYRTALKTAASGVPGFNPQDCTACGACWSNCPDSAIATVAITPKALIETGIRLTGADALRQVTSKLASRIARRCRHNEIKVNNAGELLNDAFDWLKQKSGLPEERLQSIEADFDKAHAAIADLPIVTSELLFYAQEKKQNDSGELFSLIINPDTCKACGLCVELCEPQALSHTHSPENLRQQWQIWQQTADTSSATIERLIQTRSMGTGAALMLSRHNAFALSGGDHGELASGEKIAMRQILSAVEYHQQPLLHRFVTELEQLRDELKQEINSSLSEALPTDNLAQLSEKLSDVKTRQVDLNALLDKTTQTISHATHNTAIDAVKTRTLVTLVLQINDLHWKLTEGSYGLGRARYSLCITSSSIASWAGTFPYNPFHVPVNIDVTGESAPLAAGLVQGQVKDILSAISLMRQARARVDTRYAKETEQLEQLDWHDLTYQEQQLCPPLLLVGGDDLLGTHGFSQVSLLLNSSYPVKIVIFNELDSGLVYDGLQEYKLNRRTDSRNNLAMMALSQRNAYVAQTSIADSTHLQRSVHELLSNNTAGLLCVHTPSPERHGFKPEHTLRQAQLAVKSRMFPLFRYNPETEGVFGSRISLAGNGDSTLVWMTDEAENQTLTPAHWAIHEKRFQSHFSALQTNAPFPVELSDWLNLTAAEQKKKTPFVTLSLYEQEEDKKDEQKHEQKMAVSKMAVSKELASMVINQQNNWRTLQELAGIVTPFTDDVEKCVEQRLSSQHQADLDALREEYEAKIAQLNENYQHETHTKVRNQLLGLAGYDVSNLRE